MLRIGLTGGIGAGKSTAADRFAARGARVIDHDELARRAVDPGSAALADIASAFGAGVVVDGVLDRAQLAALVFADASQRERLNGIVHPYVTAAARAADRQARAEGVCVVVHDIPLLVETGQGRDFDLVVTVAAPLETRIERLTVGRGMAREAALARIDAQADDADRAAFADIVLDGGGTPAQLWEQVDAFWDANVPC